MKIGVTAVELELKNMLTIYPSPEEIINKIELKEAINFCLNDVVNRRMSKNPERDVLIFKQYYGIEDGIEWPTSKLSKTYKLSQGRILVICHRVMRSMRHPLSSRLLRVFY